MQLTWLRGCLLLILIRYRKVSLVGTLLCWDGCTTLWVKGLGSWLEVGLVSFLANVGEQRLGSILVRLLGSLLGRDIFWLWICRKVLIGLMLQGCDVINTTTVVVIFLRRAIGHLRRTLHHIPTIEGGLTIIWRVVMVVIRWLISLLQLWVAHLRVSWGHSHVSSEDRLIAHGRFRLIV